MALDLPSRADPALGGLDRAAQSDLKLELGLEGKRLNAIHFGGWDGDVPPPRVRIAYRLTPDDYRGGEAIQLVVTHLEPAPGDGNC